MATEQKKKFVIRNPDEPATDKQLWHLNKNGWLFAPGFSEEGKTITKGQAGAALDKLFAQQDR